MQVQNDFADILPFTAPVSDPEHGVWWYDNQAHCAIPVKKLRHPPGAGTITMKCNAAKRKSMH
ncbi:putative plasmid-related protein [Erwinia amylovora Ea644]|nr:putative plasmid-related protein [Erwinia amylovora Ea644]